MFPTSSDVNCLPAITIQLVDFGSMLQQKNGHFLVATGRSNVKLLVPGGEEIKTKDKLRNTKT